MAQKKAPAVGFKSGTSKKSIKAPDSSTTYSHKFSGLIPGDVAIAVEPVMEELGLTFEEISTIKLSYPGGQPEEIPFMRYQSDDGIEVPIGTWRVEGLGDLTIRLSGGSFPVIELGCMLFDKSAKELWQQITKLVTDRAKSTSIFRGKALQVMEPMDLLVPSKLRLDQELIPIFNDHIEKDIRTCIMWPLQNRAAAKAKGIRVRRGALLEGFYGSGKSLALYAAARAAREAEWSVVNMAPGMIHIASLMAPVLAPVCLIVEDVDAGAHGDRDNLTPMLNTLSSVGAKCTDDFMLLVSTNFLPRIEPALLRPERIDAVIPVGLPKGTTIDRLIRSFAGASLDPSATLDRSRAALHGCTPAIIAEAVQRCLINNELEGRPFFTEDDLIEQIIHMDFQKKAATPRYISATAGDTLAKSMYMVTQGMVS